MFWGNWVSYDPYQRNKWTFGKYLKGVALVMGTIYLIWDLECARTWSFCSDELEIESQSFFLGNMIVHVSQYQSDCGSRAQ